MTVIRGVNQQYAKGGESVSKETFIPHPECMVATGDCFRLGKCLGECKKRSFYQHQADLRRMFERVTQLECRILKLEKGTPSCTQNIG